MLKYIKDGMEAIKFEKSDFKAITEDHINFAKAIVKNKRCPKICTGCPFHYTNNALDNDNLCGKDAFGVNNIRAFARYKAQ